MKPEEPQEHLREILENLRVPERLDTHPWVNYLFVREATSEDPSLAAKNPGSQLVGAVKRIFSSMMPTTPPKRGKRLDTRWGEFGLLAAQYFAPFVFGLPAPQSMREAWGKIDLAILWFVFEKTPENLAEADISRYKLVRDEPETAPNSTISDWHRKGISHLNELILERENHLSRVLSQSSNLPQSTIPNDTAVPAKSLPTQPALSMKHQKWLFIAGLAALLFVNIFLAAKVWQDFHLVHNIQLEVTQLQALISDKPDLTTLKQAGEPIANLHNDLGQLRANLETPLKAAGVLFGWLPVYGPDIAASADLLEMADETVASAQLAFLAANPLIDSLQSKDAPKSPAEITKLVIQAGPQFQEARQYIEKARAARAYVDTSALSPKTRGLVEKLDPLLGLLDDGLTELVTLPKILGASSAGPQTYLLLVQNEDELRATGGFITSVGSFVVRDGDIFGMKFQQSEDFEDQAKPYPPTPWQLNLYMNMPAFFLRDSNWSPDFPNTVQLAEYLYSYETGHSVDGVIAIDQRALIFLLRAIGPITIQGVPDPINADNVITYMREAKIPPEFVPASKWDRKAFIGNMAATIMAKLRSGKDLNVEALAHYMLQALDQRHILLQFDDPEMTALVARHGWDGAVRVGTGDFLMNVDTNIGFNKTSSVVKEKISYDVDLTEPANPVSSLTLFQENFAIDTPNCIHFGKPLIEDEKSWYPINRCYYDYFRVYLPAGARLIDANPHEIPSEWMLLGQPVPARVDTLNMEFEKINGATGFGTLLVIPGMKSLNTGFRFALPASVISQEPGSRQRSYFLKIQKQPGTLATPLTVRIHLPNQAQDIQADPAASVDSNNVLLETDLTTDVTIRVNFSLP